MKIAVTKKIVILSVLLFVLFSGGVVGAYYVYVKPVQVEHEQVKQSLQVEKQLVEKTKLQVEELSVNPSANSSSLQQKVPVQPLTEQAILLIEKAEVMSRSKVKSIGLEEEASVEGIENAKKLTLDVKVAFETYDKMQHFLELLQRQKRIVHVEALSISWQDEVEKIEQKTADKKEEDRSEKKHASTYTVKIAVFYASDLQGLEDGLPKIDIPQGSKKTNPLKPQ